MRLFLVVFGIRLTVCARLAVLIVVHFSFAIGLVDHSFAENEPTYPRPPTKAACDDYRQKMIEYSAALNHAAHECNDRTRVYGDDVRVPCSPVSWPRACATEYERSFCFDEKYGKLINQCDAEARVDDENKKKASDIGHKLEDKISREARS